MKKEILIAVLGIMLLLASGISSCVQEQAEDNSEDNTIIEPEPEIVEPAKVKCDNSGIYCEKNSEGIGEMYYCADLDGDGVEYKENIKYCEDNEVCKSESSRDTEVCQNDEAGYFMEIIRKVNFKARYGVDYSDGASFVDERRLMSCETSDITGETAEKEVVKQMDLIYIKCYI